MFGMRLDLSARGWGRVILFTSLGTLVCILVAFAIDSYSFETGSWRWGSAPLNNVIIPLVLAPPFLLYLLEQIARAGRCPSRAQHRRLDRRADLLSQPAGLHGDGRRLSRTRRRPGGQAGGRAADHRCRSLQDVNDNFGHECGDEALKIIAQTIKGVVREIDLVGRIGGEEFSVFLPGTDASRTQGCGGADQGRHRHRRILPDRKSLRSFGERRRCDATIGKHTFSDVCSGTPISGFMRPSRMAATASRSTTRQPRRSQPARRALTAPRDAY